MRVLRRVLAIAALAVALLVAVAALGRFVIHGPVSSSGLAKAVTRESGSAGGILNDDARCRETEERIWRCAVTDQEGSGGATYRVQVEPDSSCWNATLADDYSEGGMPETLSGCVYLWQWRLTDALDWF